MKEITEAKVREAVADTVQDIIGYYKANEPDVKRDDVIERLDEECDALWGQLVRAGLIDQYEVDDLIETAQPCATILAVAVADAWVEDDHGLWEGLTFGVLASIAYFSLRNLLYQELVEAGYDTNDDQPFAVEELAAE